MPSDQYSWWRAALQGTPVESEVGAPRAGFWKTDRGEAFAIWYDQNGNACCERQKFDGSRMRLDEIDALYSTGSRYPLTEETYNAVFEGNPPLGYDTRLTLKEIQAGVVWSLELGRRKLGGDVKSVETAPGAGAARPEADTAAAPAPIGHNQPPEAIDDEAPALPAEAAQEITPDAQLRAEIGKLGQTTKAFLDGIGGAPRNKAEADTLADFATTFGRLGDSAEAKRKAEKAEILQRGKEIDARWTGLRDNAKLSRGRCLQIGQAWMDAENARLAREAADAAAAAKAAGQDDAPPAAEPKKITGIGNMRTVSTREREVWVVTDCRAFLAHLIEQDGDLPSDIVEAAEKVARRRAMKAPGVEMEKQRSAA